VAAGGGAEAQAAASAGSRTAERSNGLRIAVTS
jgi:hypothetical protein